MSKVVVKGSNIRQKPSASDLGKQEPVLGLLAGAVRACVGNDVGQKKWEQNELLDTVYWLRQVLALLTGVVWGILPLTGLTSFLAALFVNYTAVHWWTNLQGLDLDAFGGSKVVQGEGLAPAVALFMLAWVVFYTMLHT